MLQRELHAPACKTWGAQWELHSAWEVFDIHRLPRILHRLSTHSLSSRPLPPPRPAAQLEEKTLSQNSYMLLIFHSRDSHTRQLRGHVSIRFPSVSVITSPKSQSLCPDPSLSSMKVGNMISKRKLMQLHNRLGVFYRSVMRNLFPEIVFGGCSLQDHCVCFSLCTQCC